MKFYDIDTEFTFGKYEGETIREVFEKDPKYIDFCFNNIDEFYVSPDVLKELRQLNPKFNVQNMTNFDDEMLESYLDEIGDIEDFEESMLENEEDLDWDEDELNLDFEDDFDDFDNFDGDDF